MRYNKGGVAMCHASDLTIGETFIHTNYTEWIVDESTSYNDNIQLVKATSTHRNGVKRTKPITNTFLFGKGVELHLAEHSVSAFDTLSDLLDAIREENDGDPAKFFEVVAQYYLPDDDGESEGIMLLNVANLPQVQEIIVKLREIVAS